ncbi:unnamed protein product [Candidula unifasciata]|uniref:MD-2-related lipid-recognition domain-containing protein n=1 Tax=Candidula unifasciata TaxID=100452 RepID=A0A8S3YKB2_9EUPU|nr:unnamed protein product [Candidula unifasciata]
MRVPCVLVVLAATVVSAAYLNVFSELELQAHNEVKVLFDLLKWANRADIHGDHYVDLRKQTKAFPVKLRSFSYTNCADPNTEIVVFGNLSINPDPIHIPGVIVASGTVAAKSPFGSPVKAQLDVWKEVFGVWVKAPCIDQFGSCTYDDFCTVVNPATCPPELVKIGLNCKCPFTAGSWNVPPVAVNVTQNLPIAISGGVRARIVATYNGSLVTCLQVQFDLA